MPLRAIKKIKLKGNKLIFIVSEAIKHAIALKEGDFFICDFKNHFDDERNIIKEINESIEVRCAHDYFGTGSYGDDYLSHPHYITLTKLKLTKKYGLLVNEYLEIVFKEIKREKEDILIFPERIVEDLDFEAK